jgi:hypothetical protein
VQRAEICGRRPRCGDQRPVPLITVSSFEHTAPRFWHDRNTSYGYGVMGVRKARRAVESARETIADAGATVSAAMIVSVVALILGLVALVIAGRALGKVRAA